MIAILEAFSIGVFAAVTAIYTFQTRIPYPRWVLHAYDKPWIFVCIFLIAISLATVSTKLSIFLMLFLFALWMDGFIFMREMDAQTNAAGSPTFEDETPHPEIWPYQETSDRRISEEDNVSGPSLGMIPLPEPYYPTFMGLNELPPGPAPF